MEKHHKPSTRLGLYFILNHCNLYDYRYLRFKKFVGQFHKSGNCNVHFTAYTVYLDETKYAYNWPNVF